MKKIFIPVMLFICVNTSAQKKSLTHDVYDGWKSLAERMISNDGRYAVYTINPQEGDGELVIENIASKTKKTVERGFNAVITEDSRYVVFRINPHYQDTRQAKIKKKKPDDMPKDSLGILELDKEGLIKIARVKGYKTSEKGFGFMAYQMEKPYPDSSKKSKKAVIDSSKKNIDMLVKLADSIIRKSVESIKSENITKEEMINAANKAAKEIIKKSKDELTEDEIVLRDAEGDDGPGGGTNIEGTDLIVRRMTDGKEKTFKLVSEYKFDKKGTRLLIETTPKSKDTTSMGYVLLYNLSSEKTDTLMRNFNDAKNFSFDDAGTQIAFVAERDSSKKSLQKFYKLWYYTNGQDSAKMIAERNTVGMRLGFTISDEARIDFSKNGKNLFFGTTSIKPAKDTTLVDFELARLDVWHYNDDYLQPMQLKNLRNELNRSYMAVMKPGDDKIIQLGAEDAENITLVDEGDADWVLAESTLGNRTAMQWEGRMKTTVNAISIIDGSRKLIKANSLGNFTPSPKGKFVYWYEPDTKTYFTWSVANGLIKNISSKINEPIYDVENDVPDYPRAAGFTGWTADDRYMLINDNFDIWQVDPNGVEQPKNITNGFGKKNKTKFNYVNLDREKRFIDANENILLRSQNKTNKYGGFFTKQVNTFTDPVKLTEGPYS
ncbi:MAG TPA: hypothetical protein PK987_12370, partial [Ferruginibacter sp.]|nr:hypothetical protein [Ferruginibacter sp.]